MNDRIANFYQEIAETLNDLIPEKWVNVHLYAEGWEGYSTEYFYYKPATGETPVLSYDIPERFTLDEEDFEDKEDKLRKLALSLQQMFIEQGQEPWSNMTFILERNGKFHIEYGYEGMSEVDPGEQREAWKAKYGIE
ncbi:immunity protein YezG family protein [Bhargavaea massiliensis]